jgi:aminoglycoside/choline kinase family phosphotransferase
MSSTLPDPVAPLASAAVAALGWPDPGRYLVFERWLSTLGAYGIDRESAAPASADASFRRYFRFATPSGPVVVMDAPPALEDCAPFVKIAALLRGAGLNAPEVIEWNVEDGFMLLTDMGTQTYLSVLNETNAQSLYGDALAALVRMQAIGEDAARPLGLPVGLPTYDEPMLRREMALFPDWYIDRHIGAKLTADEQRKLARCFDLIVQNTLAQPVSLVHRDYHSRNLMLCRDQSTTLAGVALTNPGILDFQDAVWGPMTYDVVSLLRDAYVELGEDVQIDLAVRYWERARKAGLPVASDFGAFWSDFEWMGLQRHLKILGIFARLSHRDGKHGYLEDLPLVWRYAHNVCTRYQGLGPLAHLLERLAGLRREVGYTF